MSTDIHPDFDPNKDYVGPMGWPDWMLAIINDATLGEFNYAAFLHDIGAMASTQLLRDENDKAFYYRLDEIVNAEKNYFKRQYLRFFKHFFYKAVRLNPSHYEGDEVSIKVQRGIDAKLVEYQEAFDSKISELDQKLEEVSKLRNSIYLEKKELQDQDRDLSDTINMRRKERAIQVANRIKEQPYSALAEIKKKSIEGTKAS